MVVTGSSYNGALNSDYYTAKYAAADGALLWEKRYNGPANSDDYATAAVVDGSGNVVVTGSSYNGALNYDSDYYTAKYAAADGALLWEQRYNGPADGNDSALAVAVDGSGNVVVTGSSYNGTNSDYYTAKYAAADGALLWGIRYNGPANSEDVAEAVSVDASGNVIVTGASVGNGNNYDYYTAKYAAADGALLWEQRFNGLANSLDYALAVAVDDAGNVVVTGYSNNGGGSPDYYTAKYAAADGVLLWEKRYNGPANGSDYLITSHSLALGPNGMVAVTGTSSGDYATVVYRENEPPVITCPANTVTNASASGGVAVSFTVTATDDSGVPPAVTCAPRSGASFPLGRTTVSCAAADGDGSSSACSFTVTVLGAREVKQNVLAELVALRATMPCRRNHSDEDRRDEDGDEDRHEGCRTLDAAIRHLQAALAPALWLDSIHLKRQHGERVFDEEKDAVKKLCALIKSRKNRIPDAVLQGFVDRLFRADRLLATVAIQDAITAGVPGKQIEKARKSLARGDAGAGDDKCANGIEDYGDAWKITGER